MEGFEVEKWEDFICLCILVKCCVFDFVGVSFIFSV